ncbi:MAG TPA: efflux RND transporter permease subunit, partial [Candidatus Baltobacteraceae bacterium]|nr:efflux RND transporter permease subunit [Candidatus Baltobacteraceae bacterium]
KTGIDAYAPLATAIIGGLSISTVLTLFVVPVLHLTLDEVPAWWRAVAQRVRPRDPSEAPDA